MQEEAFGDPPGADVEFVAPVVSKRWRRTVVLYERGSAVATGCVAMLSAAAGIYDVAVLPEHQRRGLGTTVTAWCLRTAYDAGADLVHLNPTTAGHEVYARLGFRDATPWRIWAH